MTPFERRNLRNGLLFISPWLFGMAMFIAYPVGVSFYHSFCVYSVLQPAEWIGVGNYVDLATDPVVWKSLWNTLYYAAFALPAGVAVAFFLALLLNANVKGLAVFRTIYFLPSLVPMVALAILWMWIFNGEYGVLNYILAKPLSWIGQEPPGWLSDPRWAKPALILTSLWGCGQQMVIYLAALQDVPEQLYEAAELDGANWIQKTRHITVPMISPVIYFNVVIGIIGTFNIFAVPYIKWHHNLIT